MFIDYDDMIAEGIVKEASDFLYDNDNASYAIYLNTPSGQVGKFRTTTMQDVKNSIYAINKNASIPDYIKKPAMFYIEKSARDHGIETGWEITPNSQVSRYVDYVVPVPTERPHYVMKIAGQKNIEIYNEQDYVDAVNMFKTANYSFNARERISVAAEMLKAAMELKVACDPYINAYAYADYSPRTAEMLEIRKALTNNDDARAQYDIVKEAYLKLGNNLPPDIFITAIEGIDKAAGVKRDVVKFFEQ